MTTTAAERKLVQPSQQHCRGGCDPCVRRESTDTYCSALTLSLTLPLTHSLTHLLRKRRQADEQGGEVRVGVDGRRSPGAGPGVLRARVRGHTPLHLLQHGGVHWELCVWVIRVIDLFGSALCFLVFE